MPTLTVRDIPRRVYERLRERASRNRRSLSGEVVTLLEHLLLPAQLDADALIAEARSAHAVFHEPLPDLIAEGKREGRRYDDSTGETDDRSEATHDDRSAAAQDDMPEATQGGRNPEECA